MLATVKESATYTPEDLLTMQDSDHLELVDGQLVEKTMSSVSSNTAMRIGAMIQVWAGFASGSKGKVFGSECSYQCYPFKKTLVRRPDVSFVRASRLRKVDKRGHVRIAPDLAVEVVSPTDWATTLDEKVEEYLKAGVPMVWEVHPEARKIYVHLKDGSTRVLRKNDMLDGGEVLPGFSCKVGEIFG